MPPKYLRVYCINFNIVVMEEKDKKKKSTKVYKPIKIEAKNAPYGSYAAGCGSNYGDCENCYICDYGG